MSGPIVLELSIAGFDELHGRLDRTRRTSTTVTVPRDLLGAMLRDHSRVLARLVAVRIPWKEAS